MKIQMLKEEQKLLDYLNSQQVTQLIGFKPAKGNLVLVHALCLLLIDTGLRFDEAISLTREEVDFENLTLKVKGKGNKVRLVPFSSEMRKVLWKHTAKSPGRLLFHTHNQTKFSQRNLLRQFHRLGRILGFHIHPHGLRHVFAVNYQKNGGNLEYLRRILGHSDLKTTQKYLRGLGVDDLQAVHNGLSLLSR